MSQMSGENERSANVVLTADVDQYRQSIQTASVETTTLTQRLSDLSASMDRISKSAGGKMQLFGAGSLASIAAATTSYALFERNVSSLAATAAVTGRNFDAMTRSVNNLRREFPTTTAEAAQLVNTVTKMQDGTASVNKLAKTFVKLGAATGESTGVLTTGLLQLQRTMGTSQKDTERFANSLTVLSQKNGVSAQGILDFSAAIAPMAKVAGMSQQAVMGVSAAFMKAGQDGMVAGNAFNKMLGDIMQSVTTGNGDLAKYSNLIGVTVEQFQKMDKTKAITQIFDELNRMGPNAISILNRMGYDGIRTIKSITAMTQQTGGIGKAVSESMSAFADGGGPNSALNKGSKAAMGGLIDELTKLKNTFAQIGESIGKTFAPAVTTIVKGMNGVADAISKLMAGPVGTLMSWLGGLSGIAAGAAGGLMKIAGPLLSIVTGVMLLRNHGTGGFMAGLGRTGPGTLGGKSQNAYLSDKMNPIARTMFVPGFNVGAAVRTVASAFAPSLLTSGGPSLASRVLGMPLYAAAAGMRFVNAGLQAGYHPIDPTRRAVWMPWSGGTDANGQRLTPWQTLKQSFQLMNANAQVAQSTGSTAWAARAGHSGFRYLAHPIQSIAQSSEMGARFLGVPYNPSINKDLNVLKGHLTGGFEQNLKNAGAAAAGLSYGLAKTTVALSAMTAKAVAVNALPTMGKMAGSLIGGAAGLITQPMMMMMLGIGAYTAAKGKSDQVDYMSYTPVMDTYAKAVGDATTATTGLAQAMRNAIDDLPKQRTREAALSISDREYAVASSSDYKYTDKKIEHLPLPALKAFAVQRLNDPEVTPDQIQKMALDLVHRTDDPELVTRWLKEADAARIPNWGKAFASAFNQNNGTWDQNAPFWNGGNDKKVQDALAEISTADQDMIGMAQRKGKEPAAAAQRQSNFVSQLSALAKVGQVNRAGGQGNSTIGQQEWNALYNWINDNWFGGKASIGDAMANVPGGLLDYDIDVKKALGKFGKGGVEGVLKSLVGDTYASDNSEDDIALARRMGINTKQFRQLAKTGYYRDPGARTINLPGGIKTDYSIDTDDLHGYADIAKNKGLFGQTNVEALMKDYLSAEEKTERRWRNTDVGRLITGNETIEKALKPQNSENQNVQVRAADELAAKMREAGWGAKKTAEALTEFKGIVGDVGDVLYQLGQNAGSIMKAQQQFNASFMSPSGQFGMSADNYFGTVAAHPGNNKNFEQEKKDAEQQALAGAQQAISFVKSAAIQQREFGIQVNQAERDFELSKERNNQQYRITRRRARRDYNTGVDRSEEAFDRQRRRSEQEYQISRGRAEFEFNLSRKHAEFEFHLGQSRMMEDYYKSRRRANEQFQISMADAEADFRKSRLRGEADFNHQVELMVKQSAQNMMSIMQRTSVQRTWSASGLLANARDQNRRMAEQAANLDKLRGMGGSKDLIQQLDLTNPQNAQQLARLVSGMAQDPALVGQWNAAIAERLKNAGSLVKDSDNAAWEEMQRSYKLQVDRAQEDFDTQVKRSRRNFQIQMRQQAEDLAQQIKRSNADFNRQMKWSLDAQTRQMKQAATDHKRMMNQSLADHKLQMKQASQDFTKSMKDMKADHKRQINQMITDFDTMMTRMKNQNARTIKDMSMSINQIFKMGANQLDGELEKQLHKVEKTWNRLSKLIFAKSKETREALLADWGFAVGTGKKPTAAEQRAAGNNYKPGDQPSDGGSGGGDGGTVRPEKLGVPVRPVPTSAGGVTTHFGAHGSSWSSGTHTGNDYGGANTGDPIFSVLPGQVVFAGWNGPYGNMVKVNHGKDAAGEVVETWYAHMSKILAHKGDKVGKGAKIGQVGETGNAHGAHLHLELRLDGKAVNPDRLWQGLKVSGMPYAGSGGLLSERYGWEDLVEKTPFLNKMFEGDLLSRGFNKIVEKWAKKKGVDLSAFDSGSGDWSQFAGQGGNNQANVALGKAMAATKGWKGSQWDALYNLWMGESKWDHQADNPGSSAYGIPQALQSLHALPAGYYDPEKSSGAGTASFHGRGGDPAVQIGWGLDYIKNRYGTPAKAWAAWQSRDPHWYGEGSIFTGARHIGVGERGPEAVFPLNERGADFMASLLHRFGVGDEAKKSHTCGTSVPMSNTVYNYRIDSSSNFHGAITVQSNDPREMAEKLRVQKRRAALTQPGLSRR